MKDRDLIPVSVKEISLNGQSNPSLKFIPLWENITATLRPISTLWISKPPAIFLGGCLDHCQSYEVLRPPGALRRLPLFVCTRLSPGDRITIPVHATIFRRRGSPDVTCRWPAASVSPGWRAYWKR